MVIQHNVKQLYHIEKKVARHVYETKGVVLYHVGDGWRLEAEFHFAGFVLPCDYVH